jgi:hypothetical protein
LSERPKGFDHRDREGDIDPLEAPRFADAEAFAHEQPQAESSDVDLAREGLDDARTKYRSGFGML